MQQNISRVLARCKGPVQELSKKEINNDRNKKKIKAKPSSLVRLLASQYSSKDTKQESTAKEDADDLEALPPPPPPLEQPARKRRRTLDSCQETRDCPLCGATVPSSDYEAHMQQEMKALDDSDAGWEVVDRALPENFNHTIMRQQAPAPPPPPPRAAAEVKEPKVYILGGAPSVAVPKNPRKLKDMRLRHQPWVPPAKAFNHYSDGNGFLDGEAIGVEVPEVGAGMAWEGMGTTTY